MERYLEINGKYHYQINNATVSVTDKVAVCFDKGSSLLLEHGDPEDVLEYYKEALKNFRNIGWEEAIKDIVMVMAKFPIRELNKLMIDKCYITTFIENNKNLFVKDIMKNE